MDTVDCAFERHIGTLDQAVEFVSEHVDLDPGGQLATAVQALRGALDVAVAESLEHAALYSTEALKAMTGEAARVQLAAAIDYVERACSALGVVS